MSREEWWPVKCQCKRYTIICNNSPYILKFTIRSNSFYWCNLRNQCSNFLCNSLNHCSNGICTLLNHCSNFLSTLLNRCSIFLWACSIFLWARSIFLCVRPCFPAPFCVFLLLAPFAWHWSSVPFHEFLLPALSRRPSAAVQFLFCLVHLSASKIVTFV